MIAARPVLAALVVLSAASCGPPPTSGSAKAASAAVGLGAAVVAAGINRAITHECWAMCRPGQVCDKASGLCVEAGSQRLKPQEASRGGAGDIVNPEGREYVVPAIAADAGVGDAGEDAGSPADAAR
jgi:hypothetical protein